MKNCRKETSSPPVMLRAATVILDEGMVFARYLDEAAEGLFRVLLGRRVTRVIAKAYTQPGHDFSFQHVTFAERNGTIVGMVSGYTAEQHRRSSGKPLIQAAGHRMIRMIGVAALCFPLMRFIDTVPDGDFYLQAITVDQEHRGEGIGTLLLNAIEDCARHNGAVRLSLDVSTRNDGARALYERRGMRVELESPHLVFLPRTRVVRMTKML